MTAIDILLARTEINDVLCLYAHALDRRQWHLMAAVFHNDALCGVGIEPVPWRTWAANAGRVFAAALDQTHHQLSPALVTLDGDVAHTQTYCTVCHRVRADAPAGGKFAGTGQPYDMLSGLRYADRFERRNGRWAIAHRQGIAEWRHKRPASDGTLHLVAPGFRGRHGDEALTARVVAPWEVIANSTSPSPKDAP